MKWRISEVWGNR